MLINYLYFLHLLEGEGEVVVLACCHELDPAEAADAEGAHPRQVVQLQLGDDQVGHLLVITICRVLSIITLELPVVVIIVLRQVVVIVVRLPVVVVALCAGRLLLPPRLVDLLLLLLQLLLVAPVNLHLVKGLEFPCQLLKYTVQSANLYQGWDLQLGCTVVR